MGQGHVRGLAMSHLDFSAFQDGTQPNHPEQQIKSSRSWLSLLTSLCPARWPRSRCSSCDPLGSRRGRPSTALQSRRPRPS